MSRLSKQQKRLRRQNGHSEQNFNNAFSLKEVTPLTVNQRRAFVQFEKNKHLMLHGFAGTGKTFIAMYLALREVDRTNSQYKKVALFRSTVQTREMGHLPGSHKDKAKVYEDPYYDICRKLYDRGDAYDVLKNKKLVEFYSTSFIRGITLDDCIIIIDEFQNMIWHEIYSLVTRMGNNCRIICCGDFRQNDLKKEESGVGKFLKVAKTIPEFEFIEYVEDDIVRSEFVKKFIIECDKLGL
jgi:phosphate starvation-inducible protein PhoH